MMKRLIKVFLLFFFLCTQCQEVNANEVFDNESHRYGDSEIHESLANLDSLIEKALSDFNVPGLALGIIIDGKICFAKGYGYRNVEYRLPVTTKTLFGIGSCTKAFTTCLISQLVEKRILSWDEPIIRYLPNFALKDVYATENINLRDLVSHRSGLAKHDLVWYRSDDSRECIIEKLRYLDPICSFREKYNYQNLMYLVAGHVTEKLTDQTWENLVKTKILDPLEMIHTNFSVIDSQNSDDYSLAYCESNGKIKNTPLRDICIIGPAGSINSNIEDMLQWVQFQIGDGTFLGNRLINEASLHEMHSPQMVNSGYPLNENFLLTAYGLGWNLHSYFGHYVVEHKGNIDGFTSCIALLPFKKAGVVVLTNMQSTRVPVYLIQTIIDKIFKFNDTDWFAKGLNELQKEKEAWRMLIEEKIQNRILNTQPSHLLEEYVGEYEHPAYGSIEIRLKEECLHLKFHNITMPLFHWQYDVFVGSFDQVWDYYKYLPVDFKQDKNGCICEIGFPLEPHMDDIIFHRK